MRYVLSSLSMFLFLLQHTDITKFTFFLLQSEEGDGGVDSEKEKEDNRSKGMKVWLIN